MAGKDPSDSQSPSDSHIKAAVGDPVWRLRGPGAEQRLLRLATYASAATASVLIATKLGAWLLTDSIAMLSSLIDSLLDLVASLITLLAVRQAMVPADGEHRFGHGKAEPLAAMAQAGFIAGSAVLLLSEAVGRLFDPQPIQQTAVGIGVMTFSIAATLGLVTFQRYVIARSGSVAIRADSAHYKADLLANLGVIAALAVTGFLDLPIVDPIFGIAVAGFIAYGAWEVGSDAYQMLMDRELPEEDRARIEAIARAYPEVLGVHDLRTRRSGPDVFIQMHLDFNGQLTLNRAHTVTDAVEKEIMETFKGAEVIVHQDPVTPAGDSDTGPENHPSKILETGEDEQPR
jgi:ferrous-iron efflux pump FieF